MYLPRKILNDSLGKHHEHRTGNTLSADIRDDQTQVICVNEEKVVKIPAHVPRGIHGRKQIHLSPIRIGRENVRKHAFLDLSGCVQFPDNQFLLPFLILQFHLLPLHPADRIHLLPQSLAGLIDFLLHPLKFDDTGGHEFPGFQIAFSHADDSIEKRVKLRHASFQP